MPKISCVNYGMSIFLFDDFINFSFFLELDGIFLQIIVLIKWRILLSLKKTIEIIFFSIVYISRIW